MMPIFRQKASFSVLEELDVNLSELDIFANPSYCEGAGIDINNCYYLYNEEYFILVNIVQKYGFKYGSFVSSINKRLGVEWNRSSYQAFLDDVVEDLRKKDHIQWINSTATHFVFPSFPKKAVAIPFGSYCLSLNDKTEEELLMNMNGKHRNVVRRAEREGVYIKFGRAELIPDYISVDKETWARSGLQSRGENYYSRLVTSIDSLLLGIAYSLDGVPQAGAIVPYSATKGYYLHGCTIDSSVLGSANLLQWEIIKKLKSLGVKQYDFAGCRIGEDQDSKYHNIQRFKERFGGKLEKGFMFKVIFVPSAYKLYKKLIEIRDHEPFLDVIDQEREKWENINIIDYLNGC